MNYPLTATEKQAADVYHAREIIVADLQHLMNTIQTCPASQLWDALEAARKQSETIGNDTTYPARFPVDMSRLKSALDALAETGNSDAANTPATNVSAAWGCSDPFHAGVEAFAEQEPQEPFDEPFEHGFLTRHGLGRTRRPMAVLPACPPECDCADCQREEAYYASQAEDNEPGGRFHLPPRED